MCKCCPVAHKHYVFGLIHFMTDTTHKHYLKPFGVCGLRVCGNRDIMFMYSLYNVFSTVYTEYSDIGANSVDLDETVWIQDLVGK